MEGEPFEELPDELDRIVAATWECRDPEEECSYSSIEDVYGPYPRLTDEGEITFGGLVPGKCPECGSKMYAVNGVEVVDSCP